MAVKPAHPSSNRPARAVRAPVAGSAVIVLLLSACSGAGEADAGGEESEVTLRFAWWGGDSRHSATEEIIAAFEAENPGITVEPEPGDWGGYWDKLATQVAADDAPDIIQMEEKYIREYADRGALLDLDGVPTSDIPDDVVQSGVLDGDLYGLATGINATVIMTNPDIFEELGTELPDDTVWTWQEFADIAQQVAETSDYYGASAPIEPTNLQVWLRQQGKNLADEEGEIAFEVADLEEYFQLQLGMLQDGALPEASILAEEQSAGADQSLTGTGQVALAPGWTNVMPSLSASAGSDLVPLRIPQTEGSDRGHQMFYKSSMYMSGSARTDHPEEVKKFIDFMVNSEEAGSVNLGDRGLPANLAVREQVVPELEPVDQRVAEFLDEIEDELGEPMPIPPLGFSTVQEVLMRYEMEVWFERLAPAEAAEQAYTEIEQAIGG